MEKQISASVPTTAAPINIIDDQIIRSAIIPDGSILRGLLTADSPSRQAATITSADNGSKPATTTTSAVMNESKLNLLEGLGDYFFNNEPVDNDDEIAHIIAEVASTGEVEEAAATVLTRSSPLPPTPRSQFSREVEGATATVLSPTPPLPPTPRFHFSREMEEATATVLPGASSLPPTPRSHFSREVEGAAATVLPRTSPLPPTPRPHFSRISSTFSTPETMPDPEIFSRYIEERPLSPVLTGRKRKFFGAGKGKKMFKLSREEEGGSPSSSSSTSSLHSPQLFSQPEHKALVRDYRNLISQVEKQRRLCQQRGRESQRRLTSLTSRREEAEARLTHNRDRLRRFLEQFDKLQREINRLRSKCREDDDLVRSLFDGEAKVREKHDSHQEQLAKCQQRLVALRGVLEGQ